MVALKISQRLSYGSGTEKPFQSRIGFKPVGDTRRMRTLHCRPAQFERDEIQIIYVTVHQIGGSQRQMGEFARGKTRIHS